MMNTVNFGIRTIGVNTSLANPMTGVPQTTPVPQFPGFPPVVSPMPGTPPFNPSASHVIATPPFNPYGNVPQGVPNNNILGQLLGGVANGNVHQGQPVYNLSVPTPQAPKPSLLESLAPALVGGGFGLISALIQKSSQDKAIASQEKFREQVLATLSNAGASSTTHVTVGTSDTSNTKPEVKPSRKEPKAVVVPTTEEVTEKETAPKKPTAIASSRASSTSSATSFKKLMN